MFIRKRKRKTVIVSFPLEIDGRTQLLNLKKKQHHIDIVVNYRKDKTTKYSIPIDIFEKVYDDLKRGN